MPEPRLELEYCTYCPKMCRLACPVSNATGRETWNESERERARRAAEEIKSAAKDAAASTASALRSRLSGELDYRKYRSRQRLNRVADALLLERAPIGRRGGRGRERVNHGKADRGGPEPGGAPQKPGRRA